MEPNFLCTNLQKSIAEENRNCKNKILSDEMYKAKDHQITVGKIGLGATKLINVVVLLL